MHEKIENIPVVEAISNMAESVLPVSDEHADTYHAIAGIWIAGGAFTTVEVAKWLETASSAPDTKTLVGSLAVAAVPTGVSAFFWRRGWRSRDEL